MDEFVDETLKAPREREEELLQTDRVNTLSDIVDAHGDSRYDLEMTTRGIDPADLKDDDKLSDIIGYAGNFSDDGLGGEREGDALGTDYDGNSDAVASELDVDDDETDDGILDTFGRPEAEMLTRDEEAVLSGGIGNVHAGASLPSGYQIEEVGGRGMTRRNTMTDDVTDASSLGMHGAEDEDDVHAADVTAGT